jgi:hypothetical protein
MHDFDRQEQLVNSRLPYLRQRVLDFLFIQHSLHYLNRQEQLVNTRIPCLPSYNQRARLRLLRTPILQDHNHDNIHFHLC